MAGNLIPRLFRPPKGSYFLFGPRGCGKSTLLRQLHAEAHWIDLLDEGRYQSYLVDPSLFSAELDALADRATVVIDEVQRLPNLLNVVHQKIETKRLRFALLGSSARKLRRSGVNLLAGQRCRHLHPYLPEELGDAFRLTDVLDTGALAIIQAAEDRRDALSSYVQLYLKEEIQAEAATRNLAGFARFLPIAALFHAQSLNVSSLARDAGVARTTVQGYLQILEDTLFTFQVPAYEARLRVVSDATRSSIGSIRDWFERWRGSGAQIRARVGRCWRGGSRNVCVPITTTTGSTTRSPTGPPPMPRRLRSTSCCAAGAASSPSRSRRTALASDSDKGLRAVGLLAGVDRRIVVYQGTQRLLPEPGIEVMPVRVPNRSSTRSVSGCAGCWSLKSQKPNNLRPSHCPR